MNTRELDDRLHKGVQILGRDFAAEGQELPVVVRIGDACWPIATANDAHDGYNAAFIIEVKGDPVQELVRVRRESLKYKDEWLKEKGKNIAILGKVSQMRAFLMSCIGNTKDQAAESAFACLMEKMDGDPKRGRKQWKNAVRKAHKMIAFEEALKKLGNLLPNERSADTPER